MQEHSRNCPVCAVSLREIQFHAEHVDLCMQCGGIFFDRGELESLVRIIDIFKDTELDEEDIPAVTQEEISRIVVCPACTRAMEPRELATIVFDECGQCGGIWLDGGEVSVLKLAERHIVDNLNLYIRLGQ